MSDESQPTLPIACSPGTLNRVSEVTHPSECHARIMLNGDDTHEGRARVRRCSRKASARRGSQSAGSFQHGWHEVLGVVHVRAPRKGRKFFSSGGGRGREEGGVR